MDMVAWPAGEPCSNQCGFMCRVVVHDDVDIEVGRHLRVDLLEEVQKLGGAMPLVAFADHEAGGDVERREQRGRAVPDVAMGSTFGHAGHHRQDRLFAVECLDLALLVDAEHERSVGW